MKFLNAISLFVLTILLASCGPAELPTPTPMPTDEASAIEPPEPVAPEYWSEYTDEWTTYYGVGYFSSQVYDPKGYLWLSTPQGIFRLNMETGRYELLGKPEEYRSGSNYLTFFDDKLWMALPGGYVASYNQGIWKTEEVPGGYPYGFINLGDSLWYMGEGAVFYRQSGDDWRNFIFPEEYVSGGFTNVARSGDGVLWFSRYDMVLAYDGVNWVEHENLAGVGRMLSFGNGKLLFTYDGFSIVYDNGVLTPLSLPNGDYSYTIQNLFLTPEGNIWFQPHFFLREDSGESYLLTSEGIEQLPEMTIEDYPSEDLYNPTLMIPQGWVFTAKGVVYLFDGQDWREYPLERKNMLDMSDLYSPIGFTPNGKLWFSNGDRPVSFDGKSVEDPFEVKHCERYYNDGFVSPEGSGIWLASFYQNALCYYDLESGIIAEGEIPFIPNSMDIAPDGNLWLSSNLGFIAEITPYALRKGDYRLVKPIRVGGEDISNPLEPNRILVDAFGSVWVYVQGYGVYRYKEGEWKSFGMANIDQTSLDVDSNGDVWVGKPGKLLKHENGKWVEYPQACICPTRLTISPQDVFWFVNGCSGVYMYDHETWTEFTVDDLGGSAPNEILFAPDGAVWFFNYDMWKRYKPKETP